MNHHLHVPLQFKPPYLPDTRLYQSTITVSAKYTTHH